MIYFSNMCYGVYYHIVKFQLKSPPRHGEMKKQITVEGNLNKMGYFEG